jgi:glucose-1-phosphate thymidylyltransferase
MGSDAGSGSIGGSAAMPESINNLSPAENPAVPRSVTAIVPAAGRARRLGGLPMSKELLPVGFDGPPESPRPRLVCQGLLEALGRAQVERALMVVRRDKLDIPGHLSVALAAGTAPTPPLAYVVLDDSASLPETLRRALPFARRDTIALGFPDILFEPEDAFVTLLAEHRASGADLTLGLFPTPPERRPTTDMVRLEADGRVSGIEVRPASSALPFNWLLAVWEPVVSQRLAAAPVVPHPGEAAPGVRPPEPQLGAHFVRAVADGLRVRGVPFAGGGYRDLGTPGEWIRTLGRHDDTARK